MVEVEEARELFAFECTLARDVFRYCSPYLIVGNVRRMISLDCNERRHHGRDLVMGSRQLVCLRNTQGRRDVVGGVLRGRGHRAIARVNRRCSRGRSSWSKPIADGVGTNGRRRVCEL